jgi:hypothetical protein
MHINTSIRSPILLIACCIGIITHAAYSSRDHQHYGGDTRSYLIPADNLRHGLGFVNARLQPELFRTPGYPLLLTIFRFGSLRLDYLIFIQHILCVLLIIGVAAFAQRTTGSTLVAFVTALVLSLDVATIQVANLFLTEVTFTVLISTLAWVIYRVMTTPMHNMLTIMAAGLLGGSAVLVRPVALLYFVPLSICLVWALRREALRPVLIFVVYFLFFPLLWATRNFVEADYFGISTVGAEDVLYDQAVGALAIQRPGNYSANVLAVQHELDAQWCVDSERMYKLSCSQVPDSQKAGYCMRKGLSIILRNPLSRFRSILQVLTYMLFGGGAEALSRISHVTPRMAQFMILIFTVPYLCLAVVGCRYWYRCNRHLCYILVLSIAYFLLISALGVQADSRLRVPVMPMYALLIGGGTAGIAQLMKHVRTPRFTASNN